VSVLVSALVLGACRGENLFSLTGTVSGGGPSVMITAPVGGLTVLPGDSILIVAEITASAGLSTVGYRGEYADSIGGDAYIAETAAGAGVSSLSVNNRLRAVAGQVVGSAYIIVEATDLAGAQGADSVKVTITN